MVLSQLTRYAEGEWQRYPNWQIFSEEKENSNTENVSIIVDKEQSVWGMSVEKIHKKIGSKALNTCSLEKMLRNDSIPEEFKDAGNVLFFGTVYKHPDKGLGVLMLEVSKGGQVPEWDDFFYWKYDIDFIPFSSVLTGNWIGYAVLR
ncbi:MAG: hypothetical protein ACD_8C00067G0002 [uncultured bacterium]|nr:MAG: hypothetical protein ACD_8C00067G0002 [uncultured bacterium]